MARDKKPTIQDVGPKYPDLDNARMLRRRFLAIVGGGLGATVLISACGSKEPGVFDDPPRTGGTPPALKPDAGPQKPVRLPGRPMLPTQPSEDVPDGGPPHDEPEKPGDRLPGRQPRPETKPDKGPPPRKLGGVPVKPDLKQ